jgi:four helix bundle protein
MNPDKTGQAFDLEERSFQFARRVRLFVKQIPKTLSNCEDIKQLVRASGSVGANYIEANESLGKNDFLMHIKISRKEAKESHFWLRLIDLESKRELEPEHESLLQESGELTKIFGAIYRKSSS